MRKGEQIDDSQPSYYARTRARREQQNEAEFQLGYLLASIEQSINAYAEKTGFAYSVAHTTFRVAEILSSKALRQEPGLAQLLQQMRSNGTAALRGAGDQLEQFEFVAEEALHVRPRVGRPLGPSGRGPGRPPLDRPPGLLFRAKELGRPLTDEEKRSNWRLEAKKQRIKKGQVVGKGVSGYWEQLAPEERSAEMRRRQRIRMTPKRLKAMRANAKKARAARMSRIKGSPEYEAQRHRERVAKAARDFWAKMTPEQRSKEIARRKAVAAAKRQGGEATA